MNFKSRLVKLEKKAVEVKGRCPKCPMPSWGVVAIQEGDYGEPVPTGEVAPGPCAACGRPAEFIAITEVIVSCNSEMATVPDGFVTVEGGPLRAYRPKD